MDFTALHLASLILTIPVILYADHMGFMYFTGRQQTLSARATKTAHYLVMAGIALLVITGVIITVPRWTFLIGNPFFFAKLAFVATLLINGFFIHTLMKKATVTPFTLLSAEEKRLLMTSGAISGISWVATIVIGFLGL